MRILHLCNKVPFPGRDGSSLAMHSLIRLEVALGHDVHVVALNTEKHYVADPKAPWDSVTLEAVDVRTAPHWTTALRNLATSQSYYASRFWDAQAAARIQAAAAEADLVVFDSLFMAVYADACGTLPQVLRAHNVEHAIWLRGLRDEPWFRRTYVALQARRLARWEIQMAQRVNRIWAISPEDQEWFASISSVPTLSLPCTMDSDQWPESGSESPRAYHLGALDWTPNIRGMQWFLDDVVPHLNDAQIDIYSRQWPFESTPRGVTYRAESDVNFADYGLFIAPIRSGSGMRIKLLEAMARGKAIVTTPLGAEGLGAEPGVHLCIAERPDEFALALDRLSRDRDARIALGAAAARHARTFFADSTVEPAVAAELATFAR